MGITGDMEITEDIEKRLRAIALQFTDEDGFDFMRDIWPDEWDCENSEMRRYVANIAYLYMAKIFTGRSHPLGLFAIGFATETVQERIDTCIKCLHDFGFIEDLKEDMFT